MKFKIIPTLYLMFLTSTTYSQKHAFVDIPLSKSDFEIKEGITNHPYDARIYTEVLYDYKVEKQNEKSVLIVDAKLYINSDKSWIKKEFWQSAPDSSKVDLLAHEKGHLLVALIHFKELENLCRQASFSKQQYRLELRNLYRNIDAKGDSMNIAYDIETNHSRIREKQKEWIIYLIGRINSLYLDDKIKFNFEVKTPIKD